GRTSALSAEQIAALRKPAEEPAPVAMTELDRRLLPALALDGRAAYPSLARAVGWSESAVRRRLAELRRAGMVRFEVEIDPVLFGFTVQSLLSMTVAPGRLSAVARTVAEDPEAAFVAAITGTHNLLAIVVCRDIKGLFACATERIGALEGVERMEVTPISGYSKRTAPPR
ncbi:Lrp/AsnC family transcriptional regulator, partial [Nocardia tenerifensis]